MVDSKRQKMARMFFLWVLLGAILLPPVNALTAAPKKRVIDEVLDILKSKKIITEDKYQELKTRLEKEREESLAEVKKAAEDASPVVAGYKKGFYLKTRDDAFKLKIGGRLNFDYRGPLGDTKQDNTFKLRRARLYMKGNVGKFLGFKLQEEFSSGATLKDAFTEARFNKSFRLKAGQFKTPFSLSAMSSSLWMDLPERPVCVDALAPYRDYGIMIQGDPFQGLAHYSAGLFNGTRENYSETDGSKDVAGRVVFSPFQRSDNKFIKGFHVGGSFTYGRENMNLEHQRSAWWNKGTIKTPGGVTVYKLGNDVSQNGNRLRWGAEVYWNMGPFALQGEWLQVTLDDLKGASGAKDDLTMKGGYISTSYFITGESQGMKHGAISRVSPKRPFNWKKRQWGAWEIVARYDYLHLDSAFMDTDYAAGISGYTDEIWGITGGLNWWLNDMGLIRFSLSRYKFDDIIKDIGKDTEDLALVRLQIVW